MGCGSDMVARRRQRLADIPLVGLRIVDLMPADAGTLVGGGASAADQMDLAVERDGRGSTARTRARGAMVDHLSAATS